MQHFRPRAFVVPAGGRESCGGCLGRGEPRVHRCAGPLQVVLLRRDEHASCPCPTPPAPTEAMTA
eukprot:4318788-Prymnesium_polylepis.1